MANLNVPISFLKALKENNNREWFQDHKKEYQAALDEAVLLADDVLDLLKQHDEIETVSGKKSLYRIYRDTRFSKDKTPYKSYFSGYFKRATRYRRGGYYFHIEPGNVFVGGGFWSPNSQDLLHIRKQIVQEPDQLETLVSTPDFKENFGELRGEQLKTSPKGFDKDDPAIQWLRYKQFLVQHQFTNNQASSPQLAQLIVDQFNHMRPLFDYMSEILVTDLNGEELPA